MGYTGQKKKDYAAKWVADRKKEWFKDKICVWCGNNKQLELDHIDPATKIAHSIWSWSLQRREKELVKCQVLCRSCHKIKTAQQRTRPLIHGTRRCYNNGCRCDLCRESRNKTRRKRYKFLRLAGSTGTAPDL